MPRRFTATHLGACLAAASLLAAAGCGTSTGAAPEAGAPSAGESAGDEPTTARALAFIASEHVGTPGHAVRDRDGAEEFGPGAVGTELTFPVADTTDDGDHLNLSVGEGLSTEDLRCDSPETASLAGCEETDRGVLMWEDVAPEEDPGVVYVFVDKGDSAALLFYSGPDITKDPRDLDLPISVETLFDLANDPRVDVTTTVEAIEGGRRLDSWGHP